MLLSSSSFVFVFEPNWRVGFLCRGCCLILSPTDSACVCGPVLVRVFGLSLGLDLVDGLLGDLDLDLDLDLVLEDDDELDMI